MRWTEAEAVGRSWTLRGTALDTHITLRTACDANSPALAQVWHVENGGASERVFTLSLDLAFDLRLPAVRLGSSSTSARLYDFVRNHPVARRTLGARRWGLLNPIGEAQKRLKPAAHRAAPTLETLPDGFRARGDITATFRSGYAPCDWQAAPDGAEINYRAVIAPHGAYRLPMIVAAGAEADPASCAAVLDDADAYAAWLTSAFEHDDPLLRSLFVASLNTALAMYKELPSGFRGLWAGPGYAYPPRVYFRDSYWTALSILPYRPEWVRAQLLTLASGVHSDGACPSGVLDISILPFEDQDADNAADWLPDHQDSPAYFVLLLHAYLVWSGDLALLKERTHDGRTLWACAQACLNRLVANPAKERAPNDWADNVLRSEWVTYDLALLYGALDTAAAIGRLIGENSTAATYAQDARHVGELLQIHGWDEAHGYYVDYRRTGDYGDKPFVEEHLALDTLLALRFGAAPPDRAESVLAAARRLLQTRHNHEQPYGDWGVMCCWPPYTQRRDLFAKSAKPYNYHNGAEWPYLSAIYAQLLMEHGDDDWRYALTRWWEIHLEKGWLAPVEYHTPAHPVGAHLQGWSGLAAYAMLAGGPGLCPRLDGTCDLRLPPWGACRFNHLQVHGQPRTVLVDESGVHML